jgi:silicon transporter
MVQYTGLDYFRMAYSVPLVIFSIVIVATLQFQSGTKIAADVHPAAAFCIMWGGILWMTMIEGGQCSMVGLPPIRRELYKESHPITYKICSLGHKGDNLDRYLMGRQFMVIFINFLISLCGSPLPGQEVSWLPSWVNAVFLGSGIAMVLQNVNIGQLTSQVNASHCMLDYINTHFMTFTLYVTLAIEMTGVMHCNYLIRDCFYWAAGKPVETNEPPRDGTQNLFHWGRVVFSLGVLAFSLAVTLEGLFTGMTTMWDGVPNLVSVILFFVLMSVVGCYEGMQIAFFAVSKLPASERGNAPMAMKTCEVLFRGEGRNLPGFMCGRQMTVTLCFFVIARVTTLNVEIGVDDNIFGVSDGVQKFFNMGFLGAVITTILGSISWQLVAQAFPLAFLSNPLVFVLLKIALFLEATGICAAAWFFGLVHKKIAGFQLDEVYVGTPEERAAKDQGDLGSQKGDSVAEAHMGTNVLNLPVGAHGIPVEWKALQSAPVEAFSVRRERILANIKELRTCLKEAMFEEESQVYEKSLSLEVKALKKINEEEQEEDGDYVDDMNAAEYKV